MVEENKHGTAAKSCLPGRPPAAVGPVYVARVDLRGRPFGERAVLLGFAVEEQVAAALERQEESAESGERRLIGMIMLKMGILNTTQLLAILKTYDLEEGNGV